MLSKESVLAIVKESGPCIPRDIVKKLGGDTFFVGAILSQLVDSKLVMLTYANIVGSPIYYVK